MRRSPGGALLLIVVAVVSLTAGTAGTASAHGGNPKFRSEVRSIQPAVPGLTIDVLNYDDRLLMINRTGETVAITGYEREPYARLRADGTVQVNRRSPTHYLNEERYGGTPVPPSADPNAPPRWQTVSRTGRFEWHDHRIHWMSKDAVPPQVTDQDRRTKVFDWRVPVRVGARRAALTGTLFWQPASASGVPTGAVVALVALIVLTVVLFAVTRRRRAAASAKPRGAW
jgi:hypothetical protein